MINPALAADALRILGAPAESVAGVAELVRLTGSREEFLANLILRRRVFASAPRLEATLLSEGQKAGQALTTRPPSNIDPFRAEASQQRLETAEEALMAIAEIAGPGALAMEAAWRDYVAERPAMGFDLQHRIGRPAAKGG
jgi:hypothetical protein